MLKIFKVGLLSRSLLIFSLNLSINKFRVYTFEIAIC